MRDPLRFLNKISLSVGKVAIFIISGALIIFAIPGLFAIGFGVDMKSGSSGSLQTAWFFILPTAFIAGIVYASRWLTRRLSKSQPSFNKPDTHNATSTINGIIQRQPGISARQLSVVSGFEQDVVTLTVRELLQEKLITQDIKDGVASYNPVKDY